MSGEQRLTDLYPTGSVPSEMPAGEGAPLTRRRRAGSGTRRRADSGWQSGVSLQVFLATLVACLFRGVGVFRYDAYGYWAASQTLIGGDAAPPEGFWSLRGVLTAVTFLPSSALSSLVPGDFPEFFVLLQNSIVIALFAAFLLPWCARPWGELGPRGRWVGAFTAWAVLQGFAPYPLTDLYAALAVVLAAALMRRRSIAALIGAGAMIGYSVNLRPAYLVVAALLLIAAVVVQRLRSVAIGVGVLLASAPQMILNGIRYDSLSPLPMLASDLATLQAGYAAYTVRYDTLLGQDMAQQFFCSPSMAGRIDVLPDSTGTLASTFLGNLPHSAVFALEKVAASLHWPLSIPYLVPNRGVDALFAVLVTVVTVVGCAILVARPFRARPQPRELWAAWSGVVAILLGSLITLVGSATEARFALPIVMLGAVGVPLLVNRETSAGRAARLVLVVAVVAVIGLGYSGLAHPAPPGGVDQTRCAAV